MREQSTAAASGDDRLGIIYGIVGFNICTMDLIQPSVPTLVSVGCHYVGVCIR